MVCKTLSSKFNVKTIKKFWSRELSESYPVENIPRLSGESLGSDARPTLANLARIIMYKGDDDDDDDDDDDEDKDDDGAGVSEADGGDGGGSPLKIRLNINELSLPTAYHLRLGIHAFLRRWLRVGGPTLASKSVCWCKINAMEGRPVVRCRDACVRCEIPVKWSLNNGVER